MGSPADRYKNVRRCLDEPDPAKRDACLAEATIEQLESIRSVEESIMDGITAVRNDLADVKNSTVDALLEIEVGVAAVNGKADALVTRTKGMDNRLKNLEKTMATKDDLSVVKGDVKATKDDLSVVKGDVKAINQKLDKLLSRQ